MADITIPVAQRYADKHGYNLIVQKWPEPYLSDFGYRKLEQIQGLFEHGEADVIWSLDLDTIITNHSFRIEDFIDEDSVMFITKDFNNINGGSFIVRNCNYANTFLDLLISKRGHDKMFCEQDAIVDYYERLQPLFNKYEWPSIKILPHPSINSYLYENYPDIPLQTHKQGNWNPGDFVLHLPGLGFEQRLNILKNTKIIE